MRLKLEILALALLAGSFEPATAQTKAPAAPDPAMVKRLQGEIAQAEARGDFQRAALELRIMVGLYRNDPPMRSITYSQLAQVSTQLHDEAKAAEYRALAQGLPARAAATPAFSPKAPAVSVSGPVAAPPFNPRVSIAPIPQTAGSNAPGVAAAPPFNPQVSTTPIPQTAGSNASGIAAAPPFNPQVSTTPIPQTAGSNASGIAAAPPFNPQVSTTPIPQTAGSSASGIDEISKFLAEAEQIMTQAGQVRQTMNRKATDTSQPGQPMPPPNSLPAGPDGMPAAPAPQPSLQAPTDVSATTGIVIGYDANNQPIFALQQSTSTQTSPTSDQSPAGKPGSLVSPTDIFAAPLSNVPAPGGGIVSQGGGHAVPKSGGN